MGTESGLDILLVEDDSAIAKMYTIGLHAEGHHVEIANDGHTGLRAALGHPPDLLLLDIRLPGIDGFTLLDELRRSPRCADLPVIVLSNFCEDEVIERGVRLGALAHLVKSQTTPGALAAMVSKLASPGQTGDAHG